MNTAKESEPETAEDESLCLELSVDGVSHTFELKADETRAIAIGSLPGADLRIDRPGVAPLHFHIEREGDALWIVPAYGSRDLRVDTARISGPKQIDGRSVIEFANVRIDARILDSASAVMRTSGGLPTVTIEQFVVPTFANAEQPTGRIPPISAESVIPVQRTVVIQPMRVIPLPAPEEVETTPTTLRDGQDPREVPVTTTPVKTVSDFPEQDTIEMAPFWMTEIEPECPAAVNPEPTEDIASKADPRPPNSVPLELPVAAEPSPPPPPIEMAVTTYFEPMRGPSPALFTASEAGTQSTTEFDVPFVRPQEPEAKGWLTRLGLLSKRRPVVVWLAGTGSVFALSASIAYTSRHFQHVAKPELSHSTRPAGSSPPSAKISAAVLAIPQTISLSTTELRVVNPALPAQANSAPKKGQPNDPELVAAVGHVIAGRYSDAQKAYSTLSSRLPVDPSFAVVSRLLAEKGKLRCSGSAPNTNVSCPEVKQ